MKQYQHRYNSLGRTVPVEKAERSCLKKKRFDNRNSARDAAKRYGARFDKGYTPYRCSVCSGWHLTTVKQ